MEGTVYKAIMSYERPKQIRRYVNWKVEKELGEENTKILAAFLKASVQNQIDFRVKYKGYGSDIKINKESIQFNINFTFR